MKSRQSNLIYIRFTGPCNGADSNRSVTTDRVPQTGALAVTVSGDQSFESNPCGQCDREESLASVRSTSIRSDEKSSITKNHLLEVIANIIRANRSETAVESMVVCHLTSDEGSASSQLTQSKANL